MNNYYNNSREVRVPIFITRFGLRYVSKVKYFQSWIVKLLNMNHVKSRTSIPNLTNKYLLIQRTQRNQQKKINIYLPHVDKQDFCYCF